MRYHVSCRRSSELCSEVFKITGFEEGRRSGVDALLHIAADGLRKSPATLEENFAAVYVKRNGSSVPLSQRSYRSALHDVELDADHEIANLAPLPRIVA